MRVGVTLLEHLMSEPRKIEGIVRVLQAFDLKVETVPQYPYFNIIGGEE